MNLVATVLVVPVNARVLLADGVRVADLEVIQLDLGFAAKRDLLCLGHQIELASFLADDLAAGHLTGDDLRFVRLVDLLVVGVEIWRYKLHVWLNN